MNFTMGKCKLCGSPKHYCWGCGDPEVEEALYPAYQGYCSKACLIEAKEKPWVEWVEEQRKEREKLESEDWPVS